MPYADKVKRQLHINEWKRLSRRKRGLQKRGRPPLTDAQKLASKEQRKEWERMWSKEYKEQNVEKRLLWAARRRAKIHNLEITLLESDIIVPEICPILKIPITNRSTRGQPRMDVASLDRIDSTKGYTKENVEVISWLANTMKSNATPELLVAFSKTMLERYGPNSGHRGHDEEQG